MAYCTWDIQENGYSAYHDEEWGRPLHDDKGQFEFLSLEVFQCGLSWGLVMKKRDILRSAFSGFDYDKVAQFGEEDVQRIMALPGMIKAEKKIRAVITNARCFIKVREEKGSFSDYLWSYTKGKTIIYNKHPEGWIPASNALSERISKDLKARGFKFLGPVVMYSHLQAAGLINDHDGRCATGQYINEHYPTVHKRREGEKNIAYYGDTDA